MAALDPGGKGEGILLGLSTAPPTKVGAEPCPTHAMGGSTDLLSPGRDTAGQERYQTITKQYYRRAQVRGLPGLVHRRGETEAQF